MDSIVILILFAATVTASVMWMCAEGRYRLACADLAVQTHKNARREAEHAAIDVTRRLQIEYYEQTVRELEARLGRAEAPYVAFTKP